MNKYLLINIEHPKSWVEVYRSQGPQMTTDRAAALQLDYNDAVTMKNEIKKQGFRVLIEPL